MALQMEIVYAQVLVESTAKSAKVILVDFSSSVADGIVKVFKV